MNSSLWHPNPAAEEQAALWAARLDGSVLGADDRISLDAWLAENPAHRTLLSSYCQFSADLEQQLPLLEGIREQPAGSAIPQKTVQPSPWLRRPLWAGVALTAAAAVALGFWFTQPRAQFESIATPAAQRQELTLADGTQVTLNAHTTLQIEINRKERHVRLGDGQAFFAVSKDRERPFIVETPAGAVRVTGTKFDVRAESASALEVTVAEGSVQVRPGSAATPVALKAGDQLVAGPAGMQVAALDDKALDNALAWRQGQIVFAGTPLREALARFARYHGRGITASPEAAELLVGARYSLDDLDGFFAGLEDALPVRVTRNLNGTVQVDLRPGR